MAKVYSKKGITILTNRGTAVRKMCKVLSDITAKNGGEIAHGDVMEAYRQWSETQTKNAPIGYMRFTQLVGAFYPMYQGKRWVAFRVLNDSEISYEKAIAFATELEAMIGIAEKVGVRLEALHY
jgi:hypothetical protein